MLACNYKVMRGNYWLKGAVLGVVVWVVMVCVQTLTYKMVIGGPVAQNWWNYFLLSLGIDRLGGGTLESWTVVPAIFLICGVIVGWVYGKVRVSKPVVFPSSQR